MSDDFGSVVNLIKKHTNNKLDVWSKGYSSIQNKVYGTIINTSQK